MKFERAIGLPLLALSCRLLAGCASLDSAPMEPGMTLRQTAASPSEVTYEYAVGQYPDLLPSTAQEAERHCRAFGTSAVPFHMWGGGPITNFVTYRCLK
jgi:hypothetical protein